MFERFTDRARKVMALANQEAQRLNQEYIGTEHIVLGMLKEDSGIASTVLKCLDIKLGKAREELEKLVASGPMRVTMEKLPQTEYAKKTIYNSIECARSWNQSYVGTEHLLYGLVQETEGIGYKLLTNFGIEKEQVESKIKEIMNIAEKPEKSVERVLGYWSIPKEMMDLYGFLKYSGFEIEDRDKAERNNVLLVSSPDNKCSIAELHRTSESPLEHNHIVIKYQISEEQIEEAIKLRNLLEKQRVRYVEKPSREDVAKALREQEKNLSSLIKRLECK